jgi:hypothetical protein
VSISIHKISPAGRYDQLLLLQDRAGRGLVRQRIGVTMHTFPKRGITIDEANGINGATITAGCRQNIDSGAESREKRGKNRRGTN